MSDSDDEQNSETGSEQPPLPERVRALMAQAEAAATREEATLFVKEAVTLQLSHALAVSGVPNSDGEIQLLKSARLDELLLDAMLEKRLTPSAADRYLVHAKEALRTGGLDAGTLKMAIIAFDETMQRLALAADPSQLTYGTRGNPARDMLIGFAHRLHR